MANVQARIRVIEGCGFFPIKEESYQNKIANFSKGMPHCFSCVKPLEGSLIVETSPGKQAVQCQYCKVGYEIHRC